jgi:hypothetical protein
MKKIYISGPMTGIPQYNFPAFDKAEEALRHMGLDVYNPASKGVIEGYEWKDYLKIDIPELFKCDAVAVLHGWEHSRGACFEIFNAQQVGIPVYDKLTGVKFEGVNITQTMEASVLQDVFYISMIFPTPHPIITTERWVI